MPDQYHDHEKPRQHLGPGLEVGLEVEGGAGVEALLGDLRYIFRGGVVLDMTAGHIYLGS
jgi:hypothetical protein